MVKHSIALAWSGKVFYWYGAATENNRSPYTDLMYRTSYLSQAAPLSLFRPGSDVNHINGMTTLQILCRQWPDTTACMIKHNLNLYLISSLCNSIIFSVIWLWGPSSVIRHASDWRTCCRSSSTNDGRSANTVTIVKSGQHDCWHKSLHCFLSNNVTKLL